VAEKDSFPSLSTTSMTPTCAPPDAEKIALVGVVLKIESVLEVKAIRRLRNHLILVQQNRAIVAAVKASIVL
jgi:hypothetical protein